MMILLMSFSFCGASEGTDVALAEPLTMPAFVYNADGKSCREIKMF